MASRTNRRKKHLSRDGMCPIIEAIKTIVTESRLLVVRHLFAGPKGFNELWRESGINSKTLSLALKFLEQQGIVKREIVSTRPFGVQYSLTPSGLELKPALEALGDWGSRWLPEFNDNRTSSQHAPIMQKIPNR
jgi:DNA-binding HxlR family transcriptional regulator